MSIARVKTIHARARRQNTC